MKIGIVFAGQGAQYSGMGKDLYDSYPQAKEIFDLAGDQIKEWCFEGDAETLKQTHVTQPTIYTTSMAAYKALLAELDVAKRGTLMQEAGLDENGNAKGTMAAALGKRDKILDLVEQAREDGILEGVNFNSPKQTVVAGDKAAVARFAELAKENRIKAIPLSVSTAFHSPMMIPAAEKLRDVLRQADLKAPETTVYADVTADDIMKDYDGGDVKDYLVEIMAKQAMSPVYWEEIIRRFDENGVKAIIEVGPGTTLSGLTKKTCKEIAALNVENVETLQETIAQLKELV